MLGCFPWQKPRTWRSNEGFPGIGIYVPIEIYDTDSYLVGTAFDSENIFGGWVACPAFFLFMFNHIKCYRKYFESYHCCSTILELKLKFFLLGLPKFEKVFASIHHCAVRLQPFFVFLSSLVWTTFRIFILIGCRLEHRFFLLAHCFILGFFTE